MIEIFIVEYRFIDLLCLKLTGELIRYKMSRDDIASGAEEKFPFSITCAIIDLNHNQIYFAPFNTNPSIIKIKEIINEETNDIYITDLALFFDQSSVLYQNKYYC